MAWVHCETQKDWWQSSLPSGHAFIHSVGTGQCRCLGQSPAFMEYLSIYKWMHGHGVLHVHAVEKNMVE